MLAYLLSGLVLFASLALPVAPAPEASMPQEQGCDCTALGSNVLPGCGAAGLVVTVNEQAGHGRCDYSGAPECPVLYDCTIVGSVEVVTNVGNIVSGGLNHGKAKKWPYVIDRCGGGYDLEFSIATGIARLCVKYFKRYCRWCTLPA